ncbi:MAG: AmmeMemoRadiSam system radical SAM enzyme [Acidobacteriota bacterium]
MPTLADTLAAHTRDGELFEAGRGTSLRCVACAHRCLIAEGGEGVCKVRVNRGGRLRVPWGYVAGCQSDPIEKKPFFHVHPGSRAFSFGMLGCDLHCAYCQNWISSQAIRDPEAGTPIEPATPAALVREALDAGARSVVSTYNEPLITSEWAVAVFREARQAGLLTGFVSNGHATPEVLRYLAPWIDIFKVDLKGFDAARYRALGGRLEPVIETIRTLHAMGTWLELVTLVVPGLNDSEAELTALAAFIVSVSPDIPWHVTAFHGRYRMSGSAPTTPRLLMWAAEIGRRAGLRFVYAGNAPGGVGGLESTTCPGCDARLVERDGYRILRNRLAGRTRCPECERVIPGRWSDRDV